MILSINHTAKTLLFISIFIVEMLPQNKSAENISSVSDSAFHSTKSAWTAVLLSTALPGAGQIYNESYWKAPLIWGLSGWLVYNWIQQNKEYVKYRQLYSQTNLESYRTLRTFYRDQRDMFTIYLGLTYILNLVDAYVDAQLFDFSVDEDFFIRQPRINLRINLR